jgi:ABC-type glycerol-3-phosphate transport system substrate-binding protein
MIYIYENVVILLKKIGVFIIASLIFMVLIVACNSRGSEFDMFFEQTEPSLSGVDSNSQDVSNGTQNHENSIKLSELEGELTVWVGAWDNEIRVYADLFTTMHPNVNIIIERLPAPPTADDLARRLFLITLLLTDPPDLFLARAVGLDFEKSVNERLFVNLYELFDGQHGINKDDYFSNIFSASETQGGLYRVPLFFEPMLAFPNKGLFETAGIDVSEITSISVDDEIAFYRQIAPLFPDRTIYPSPWFSIWRVFANSMLYNIEVGEVYVNTPEMVERVRASIEIPISRWVEISDNRPTNWTGLDIFQQFTESDYIFIDSAMAGMQSFATLFLQEHPDFQFSRPVPLTYGDGNNVFFRSDHSLSIMRESQNIELAWEFMRFMLEYEESLYHVPTYDHALSTIPINRNRFNNQVYDVLQDVFYSTLNRTDLENHINIPIEAFREQQIEYAMLSISKLVEAINNEYVVDSAPNGAFIIPTAWRIHSGQQSIEQGLYDLQNNLELYVNE